MTINLVSVQPDYFCQENDNITGENFCAKCKRSIAKAPTENALCWCYGCGFETGSLPMIEIPLGWSRFSRCITFTEAKRIRGVDFDPHIEIELKQSR